jgi:hypothetical protein
MQPCLQGTHARLHGLTLISILLIGLYFQDLFRLLFPPFVKGVRGIGVKIRTRSDSESPIGAQ